MVKAAWKPAGSAKRLTEHRLHNFVDGTAFFAKVAR
jgi:hypothetical protein